MYIMLYVAQVIGDGEQGMLWLSLVLWKIAKVASEVGLNSWLRKCVCLQFTAGEIWLPLAGLELNNYFMENNVNGGELGLMWLLVHRQFSLPSAVLRGLLSYPQ